jgi:hypothetical protein
MVERPVPNPIDFDIDSDTLRISAPLDKLKDLEYKHLLAPERQAEMFSYFLAGGRAFNIGGLWDEIQIQMERKKPQ